MQQFPTPVAVPVPTPITAPIACENPLAALASLPKDDEDDYGYVVPEQSKPMVYAKDKFDAEMKAKQDRTKHLSLSTDNVFHKEKFRTTSPLLSSDSFLDFDTDGQEHPKKGSPDPFGTLPFLTNPAKPQPTPAKSDSRGGNKPLNTSTSSSNNRKPSSTSPPGPNSSSVFNKDFFGTIFNNVEGKVDFLKEKVEGLKEKADKNGTDWFFSDKKDKRESKQL